MQSSLIIYLSLIEVHNAITNWEIGQSYTYFSKSEWIGLQYLKIILLKSGNFKDYDTINGIEIFLPKTLGTVFMVLG